MRKDCLLTIVLSCILANVSPSQTIIHFNVQKLADGVFAAIASDTGFAVCNAGIIDLGEGTVVFDPFMSPTAGSDLRKTAIALTGKPVIYVVNSHYHNDHIRGNQEFPGSRIISTVWTRQAMAESEPEEIKWEKDNTAKKQSEAQQALTTEPNVARRTEDKFWVKYYEALVESQGKYHTVLPDVTFEGKLVLHGPARRAELIEIGKGHTNSDLILYLPAERIVFMGDLLFIERHPYLADGSPADWLKGLERVTALGVRTAVPGHGPVGDSTQLAAMAGYIKALGRLGEDLRKRGATEKEIATQPVPGAYQTWWYSRFFLPNLKFMVDLARVAGTK